MTNTRIDTFLMKGELFLPIEQCTKRLEEEFYITGAMSMRVGGVEVITRRDWDLVDQLWLKLIRLFGDALEGKHGAEYFPDQPIRIAVEPVAPGDVRVVVSYPGVERAGQTSAVELAREMRRAGEIFWHQLVRIAPSRDFHAERALTHLAQNEERAKRKR